MRRFISSLSSEIPPVSIIEKFRDLNEKCPYSLSLVNPEKSAIMALSSPIILLKREDLPTLGLPIIATIGPMVGTISLQSKE
jgi:hypothetical protein